MVGSDTSEAQQVGAEKRSRKSAVPGKNRGGFMYFVGRGLSPTFCTLASGVKPDLQMQRLMERRQFSQFADVGPR